MNKLFHFVCLCKSDASSVERTHWRSIGGYALGTILVTIMLIHIYALFSNSNFDDNQNYTLLDVFTPYAYVFFAITISMCLIKYGLSFPYIILFVLFLGGCHFEFGILVYSYALSMYFVPIVDWGRIIYTLVKRRGSVKNYEGKFLKIFRIVIAVSFLMPVCLSILSLIFKSIEHNYIWHEALINFFFHEEAVDGFYIPIIIAVRLFLFQAHAWLLVIYLFVFTPFVFHLIILLLRMMH